MSLLPRAGSTPPSSLSPTRCRYARRRRSLRAGGAARRCYTGWPWVSAAAAAYLYRRPRRFRTLAVAGVHHTGAARLLPLRGQAARLILGKPMIQVPYALAPAPPLHSLCLFLSRLRLLLLVLTPDPTARTAADAQMGMLVVFICTPLCPLVFFLCKLQLFYLYSDSCVSVLGAV